MRGCKGREKRKRDLEGKVREEKGKRKERKNMNSLDLRSDEKKF